MGRHPAATALPAILVLGTSRRLAFQGAIVAGMDSAKTVGRDIDVLEEQTTLSVLPAAIKTAKAKHRALPARQGLISRVVLRWHAFRA